MTKVDGNIVGKKPIRKGGKNPNRRQEKWIKGFGHERRLSDKCRKSLCIDNHAFKARSQKYVCPKLQVKK